MIKRFKLKCYKSMLDVDIKVPQLAVIFGPNASGKSNLLDALNLFSRMATKKNLKEAFEGHRGFPLEAVYYSKGDIASLQEKEYHEITFLADILLSKSTISEIESRVRELRRGIGPSDDAAKTKNIITHPYLRYGIKLQIASRTGQIRVSNEKLVALRRNGEEKTRRAFIEKSTEKKDKLVLRMEGQAHPTYHDVGLDYTVLSSGLYAPHFPHIAAVREELSRCHFYYFEPRELMRQGNAIADVTQLGPHGEDMAAFYYTLRERSPAQFNAIKLAAASLLPHFKDITIEKTNKAELFLSLKEEEAYYSNRLLSEGTLRVLGLLAILSPVTGSTTIGYEEPENGVHPRRLRDIAELLSNSSNDERQIIINTHSPVLASYFSDKELFVGRRGKKGTEFLPFLQFRSAGGPMFRAQDIERYLEESIIRGDFGG